MFKVRTALWVRASTTVAVPSQLLPTNMTSRGAGAAWPAEAPAESAPVVTALVARLSVSATVAVRRMAELPGRMLWTHWERAGGPRVTPGSPAIDRKGCRGRVDRGS